MAFSDSELQNIKTKPNSNGRYYALHKYLNWVENPILWLYEKQGFTGLFFEGTEDLRPTLKDAYLDYGYYQFDNRKQVLDDLNTMLYMWNLKAMQLNSLINSLGSDGETVKSQRPDLVEILKSSSKILSDGAEAGIWRLTKEVAGNTVFTMVGALVQGLTDFIPILGAIALAGQFIQGFINRDFAQKVKEITIANITAISDEIKDMIGTEYYTTGVLGGYLKGLLDLAGMKLVTDANGNVKIVNDLTNPNNPNFKPKWDNPEDPNSPPVVNSLTENNTSPFWYLASGIVLYKILK
jgi:hypothetical protein